MKYCRYCGTKKDRKVFANRYDPKTGKRLFYFECSNTECHEGPCRLGGEHKGGFWSSKCKCGVYMPVYDMM